MIECSFGEACAGAHVAVGDLIAGADALTWHGAPNPEALEIYSIKDKGGMEWTLPLLPEQRAEFWTKVEELGGPRVNSIARCEAWYNSRPSRDLVGCGGDPYDCECVSVVDYPIPSGPGEWYEALMGAWIDAGGGFAEPGTTAMVGVQNAIAGGMG